MAHKLQTLKPRIKTLGAQQRTSKGWSSTTTSSTARGYGWRWQQARERVLSDAGGLCRPCRDAGRVTVATEVDHIVPKAHGGTDAEANLQAICSECHKAKTARER